MEQKVEKNDVQNGIVTVYASENCGSFFQAYALSKCVSNLNSKAGCVEYRFKDNASSIKRLFKNCMRAILRGNLAACCNILRKRKYFKLSHQKLKIVSANKDFDLCVLGSDTIWDVSNAFFLNHYDFFWGTAFGETKVISYAPSVGFAKKEDVEKCRFIRDALANMTAVSVRDKHSKDILQPYCDREIQVVCDPTYLIDRGEYDAIAKTTDMQDFIFLYCYSKLSASDRTAIQTLAKKEGLKTVAFGGSNRWCDINLAYDPLLFLSLYDKADYIITDTFHGTVFATIYEKKFAVIKNDKPKVLDVLEMCEMSDKMTETSEDISAILHSDFDYETTRARIQKERENALNYLKNALERCDENA